MNFIKKRTQEFIYEMFMITLIQIIDTIESYRDMVVGMLDTIFQAQAINLMK